MPKIEKKWERIPLFPTKSTKPTKLLVRELLLLIGLALLTFPTPLLADNASNPQENNELLKSAESLRMALLEQNRPAWSSLHNSKPEIKEIGPRFQLTKTRMRQTIGLIQNYGVKSSPTKQKILARVTVYWAEGAGTDPWSAKNISSTQTRLVCHHHAAVDPNVIPYGSKLLLQYKGGRIAVKAVDTGSAVKNKTASKRMGKTPLEKNAPVIDLFFQKKEDALAYTKNHPPFQWVEVIPPSKNM